MQAGGGVEGKNLQVDSLLSMEPETGLDVTIHEIMTRAKESDVQTTEQPRCPRKILFVKTQEGSNETCTGQLWPLVCQFADSDVINMCLYIE